jgi:hypothetical protein
MAPPELLSSVTPEIQKRLGDLNLSSLPNGGTAVVSGNILYYEDQTLTHSLISPMEEVIARVELTDKTTGEVIGTAICVCRVTSRAQSAAVRDKLNSSKIKSAALVKAEGLAKAVYEWIESRCPEKGD